MSLGYVKKKADSRALKDKTNNNLKVLDERYDFNDVPPNKNNFDPSEQPMNKIVVKDKAGKELGHIEYDDTILPDTIFVGDMQNYRIETGVGRAAIAKLMQKFPNKRLAWIAISDGSTKSYKKFCEEYPELAKKVDFNENISVRGGLNSKANGIDKSLDDTGNNFYNSEKGVIDETTNNKSENISGTIGEVHRTNINENRPNAQNTKRADDTEWGISPNNRGGSVAEGIHNPVRDGRTSYNSNRPISKQLTSTDGDLDQIEKVVSDVVARDTELSGTTWEALAKDADDLFNKLEEYGVKDIDNLKKAFNHGQIDVINTATRYALVAERMVGNLREQAAAILKQNGDITEIAESLAYLSDFTSKIASAGLCFANTNLQ